MYLWRYTYHDRTLARYFGDWFGVANAHAAKARLHMATGCFKEAVDGFQLVLKVSFLVYPQVWNGIQSVFPTF